MMMMIFKYQYAKCICVYFYDKHKMLSNTYYILNTIVLNSNKNNYEIFSYQYAPYGLNNEYLPYLSFD